MNHVPQARLNLKCFSSKQPASPDWLTPYISSGKAGLFARIAGSYGSHQDSRWQCVERDHPDLGRQERSASPDDRLAFDVRYADARKRAASGRRRRPDPHSRQSRRRYRRQWSPRTSGRLLFAHRAFHLPHGRLRRRHGSKRRSPPSSVLRPRRPGPCRPRAWRDRCRTG